MPFDIQLKDVPAETLAGIRERHVIIGRQYDRIRTVLSAQGLEPAGAPLAIFRAGYEGPDDIEIALPIKGEFAAQYGVMPTELPSGKAVVATYTGHLDQIGDAYEAIRDWARENETYLTDFVWERYVSVDEPDPSKWVTEIYWPLDVEM